MLDSAGAEFAKKRRPARNGTSCEGVNNVGFLYVRRPSDMPAVLGATLNPLATHGAWERESRSCSKSGLAAFAAAAADVAVRRAVADRAILAGGNRALAGRLLERLSEAPETCASIVSPRDDRRTGIVALDLGQDGARIHKALRDAGVLAILRVPRVPAGLPSCVESRTLLRLSLSDRWNTTDEVDQIADRLVHIVRECRALPRRRESRPREVQEETR